MGSNYKTSGVDTSAADDWVGRIAGKIAGAGPVELRARMKAGVGAYAAVYAQSDARWIALSCDGVGTKLLWTLEGLGTAEDLAQDLVAMNANDLLCVGARPLLFLDYLALGSMGLTQSGGVLESFVTGLTKACAESGMILVGGETAQMPDLYEAQHFDCAGFALGELEPGEHLTPNHIEPGARVYGWASDGPHSNGFSWLRKTFDAQRDKAFIQEHLMRPTRLYAKNFLALRSQLREQQREAALQGAFHVTGSGVWNFLRAQPEGHSFGFDFSPWTMRTRPVWLQELARRTGASDQDLWGTFNMGMGFAVVLSGELVDQAPDLISSLGLVELGRVIREPVLRLGGWELK